MSRTSGLLEDVWQVFNGNVVSQGLAFFTLIVISRTLGPDNYGLFSISIAFFLVFLQFSEFGLTVPYVRESSKLRATPEYANLLFTVLVLRLAISTALCFGVYFFSSLISMLVYDSPAYAGLIVAIASATLPHSALGMITSHYQATGQFSKYSRVNILHNLLRFLIVIATLFASTNSHQLLLAIYAYVFSGSLIVAYFAIHGLGARFRFVTLYVRRVFGLGCWIFLSTLSVMLMSRLDVFMLQRMSGSLDTGLYSAASQLAMIFPMITTSVITALLPKVAGLIRDTSVKSYVMMVLSKSHYAILVLAGLLLISPLLFRVVYGDQFSEGLLIFQILLPAFAIGIIINPLSIVFYETEKAYFLVVMNVIQLVVNFFGNLVFIPIYGAEGAAMVTTAVQVFAGIFVISFLWIYHFHHR